MAKRWARRVQVPLERPQDAVGPPVMREWTFASAGATHPGQRRHNEDNWHADTETGFFIVADGVGGLEAGEVASLIACSVTAEQVRSGNNLAPALQSAHSTIRQAAHVAGRPSASMAATAVALRVQPDAQTFSVAWAGDSRLYLWDGELKSLTRDHSLVESLLRRGEISRAEADTHPRRNVILVALGDTQGELEPGENRGSLPADALFMLCSDGLTDVVAADTLCSVLSREDESLQARADALVQAAVDADGRDNITALLVSCRAAGHASADGSPPGGGPVVYETFDPGSGERRREAHEEQAAPTKRRVPASGDNSGTPPAPAQAAQAVGARSPQAPRWRVWLAAVALFAGVLVSIEFVARQGP